LKKKNYKPVRKGPKLENQKIFKEEIKDSEIKLNSSRSNIPFGEPLQNVKQMKTSLVKHNDVPKHSSERIQEQ